MMKKIVTDEIPFLSAGLLDWMPLVLKIASQLYMPLKIHQPFWITYDWLH